MLIVPHTTRRTTRTWLLVLMLAMGVLAWGLRYKLSLYHSADTQRTIPAAKLLSQKERPALNAAIHLARGSFLPNSPNVLHDRLIAAVVAGHRSLLAHWTRIPADEESVQQHRGFRIVSLPRPPPGPLPAMALLSQ